MKILGITAEYNPFHNGHLYHIEQSKRITNADGVVAVMSGSFVQRGDIAICDKWSRANMAIQGGADLVIELPVIFSSQSAEFFARGAVGILEALGADYISFGTESNNIDNLIALAKFLKTPDEKFNKILSDKLSIGLSYPTARSEALREYGFTLNSPNDILAVEYLKANKTMKPIGVKRIDSEHDGYGSASYIRNLILNRKDYSSFVPDFTYEIIEKCKKDGVAPNCISNLDTAITAILRNISSDDLSEIRDVSEGLENRIKASADKSASIAEIADDIKTKRYTHSRIRRIIVNTLLGITKDTADLTPSYIRVLAMNETGMKILKEKKDVCLLPFITKTADAKADMLLNYDFKATDIYSLAFPDSKKRISGYDLKTSPIIIK